MTSRITRMSPPGSFVDEQVRGPFRSFRREHVFVAAGGGGGTIMTDHVVLSASCGVLGRAAELVVGHYIRRSVEQRNAHLLAASVP